MRYLDGGWLTVEGRGRHEQVRVAAAELIEARAGDCGRVLKRSLANLVKRDLGQLTALAGTRLRRMQYRPRLLEGFLAGTGLDPTPFSDPAIENR
jgi:hypothetical protein